MDTSSAVVAGRLRVFVSRLRRRMQDASSVGELSASQSSALARLAAGEPASASQLAGAERVRPQSMAKTLTALHELGLIRRVADADDGRRQLIFLTDEGRASAVGARARREEWLTEALGQFSEAERVVVSRALTLLERMVEK
jgi:DNA-binding MarR family transcriptional regulator